MPLVSSFSSHAALEQCQTGLTFQMRKLNEIPQCSVTRSRTYSQWDWQVGSGGRAYREEVRHSHSRTGAGEPSIFVDPKYRNAEAASLTSLAHVDNLKPDIFTFSVTVSPDHQDLALPTLSFQSFLKFPVRKEQWEHDLQSNYFIPLHWTDLTEY